MTDEEIDNLTDAQMIADKQSWPGETLCLKRRPKPGEKLSMMGYAAFGVITDKTGYAAFGVITDNKLPIVVLLRPNFTEELHYNTIENLIADGWMVD